MNGNTDKQEILFLIINRNSVNISGATISFENTFTVANINVYDCYYGKELKVTSNGNNVIVNIDIEGLGFGAILATMYSTSTNSKLNNYLTLINTITQKPLSSFSTKWRYLQQNLTIINETKYGKYTNGCI